MVRSTLLPLVLYALPDTLAFVAPRPLLVTQTNTRLYFESEEVPEPLMETPEAKSNIFGLDEDFISFPCTDYSGLDVVQLCMNTLKQNSVPYNNAGLEVCWNFSSDRCRASQGGSLEDFVKFAANPVFQSMVDSKEWNLVSTGPIIAGTPTRGAMQTVLLDVVPSNGMNTRRFLWTLQQERRPPRQGCWLVYECIDTNHAFKQTL